MDDDISFVVLSYDVGHEKPDRRVFEAAESMLKETLAEGGSNPESQSIDAYEKLYVGDSLEKDYHGAKAAGWDSLLLRREAGGAQAPRLIKVDVAEVAEGENEGTQVDACTSLEVLQFWAPNDR